MRIAVPREIDAGEPRVAATPETIKKLKSLGADVGVERGAGIASGIPDTDFEAAGARVEDAVTKDADIVLKVRRPAPITNLFTGQRWSTTMANVVSIAFPWKWKIRRGRLASANFRCS